jgi:hypothetical protein
VKLWTTKRELERALAYWVRRADLLERNLGPHYSSAYGVYGENYRLGRAIQPDNYWKPKP